MKKILTILFIGMLNFVSYAYSDDKILKKANMLLVEEKNLSLEFGLKRVLAIFMLMEKKLMNIFIKLIYKLQYVDR